VAVSTFQPFYETVMAYMCSYEPPSKREELLVAVYSNMIGRLHEHISGMLVCLATKNAPSAEALARTVLEVSVNLLFMLHDDREKAFLGYCDAWFISHERQLDQWLEYEAKLNKKTGNISKIKNRMEMLEGQKMIIDQLVSTLNMNREKNYRDVYPKSLFKRFKSLGKENQYFTSYHRLSNSSHLLAEDTISWLLGIMNGDREKLFEMGREAMVYSQIMSLIVLVTAIEAIGVFAIVHNFLDCASLVQECRSKLITEVEKLSIHAGVPKEEI
jgi:hypothetical protein